MSRFTEHFDLDSNQFAIYSQALSSPSKASFSSLSSTESSTAQNHRTIVDPIMTQSFSSFESSNSSAPSSPTTFGEEEKPLSTKLKRLLTTISKKKRSMSSRSQ